MSESNFGNDRAPWRLGGLAPETWARVSEVTDTLLAGRLPPGGEVLEVGTGGRQLIACAVELAPSPAQSATVLVVAARGVVLPSRKEIQLGLGLTAREAEVALLLACQCSDKDIAQRLSVTIHTAERHTEHILGKLGLHSRRFVRGVVTTLAAAAVQS